MQLAVVIPAPTGSDTSGIVDFAVVIIGEQQRADGAALFVGRLVSGDDEFLVAGGLGLEPVAAAAGAIWRRAPLGDDAFEMHPAGALEQLRPADVEILAEADD